MLAKDEGVEISAGDSFACLTPGGGGYGRAEDRDPALIERDLARGFMTSEFAARSFSTGRRASQPAVEAKKEVEKQNG